ncbi:VENN motif pre-toxin domain-containing protein [Limnobaculum parvum]|uniref:Uncharacterized protein n=1 Tax=Limnobaculum parvum TaxID=2172103 RepID=A0A2Y9TW38_9GAMM|nr:VENN motif pre-toxin domain-containing protein [Limnobaculum parvum]AWH87791.1 hypothetical protein HYN51_03970 [Limnobaculum parvum]
MAIADGSITIRDQNNQQQDIAKLSNDTANAANPLDKIFDADEQMRNLEAIGLAGQIVSQVTTIATNIGVKAAQDEAKASMEAASKDPAIQAQARENLAKQDIENPTQEQLNKATYDVVYQAAYEEQMKTYGTGSNVGRAIQAAGAALTVAMGGGSAGNAVAAASAPLLAQGVKRLADDNFPVDKEHPDNANLFAKVIGHAIVGLAVAEGSGNSGMAGALGAASGELIAKTIAEEYYKTDPEKLTEAQRQFIANMTSIATGVAAGLVADNTADAGMAASAAYNSATNNYLSQSEKTELDLAKQKLNDPDPLVREKARQDYDQLMEKDISSDQAVIDACGNGQAGSAGCASARQDAAAARDSYETGSYNSQAKKQYADAYGQIVSLLNSTTVDAEHKEQVTDGLARYFMAVTGVDYETARGYADTKQGMDILVASLALKDNLQAAHSYLAAEGAVSQANAAKSASKTSYNWSSGEGAFSPKSNGKIVDVEYPGGKYDGNSLPYGKNTSTGSKTADSTAGEKLAGPTESWGSYTSKEQYIQSLTPTEHTIVPSRKAPQNYIPNSVYEVSRADGTKSITYYDDKGRTFSREDYGQQKTHGQLGYNTDGSVPPHEHTITYSERGFVDTRQYRLIDSNGKAVGPWIPEN